MALVVVRMPEGAVRFDVPACLQVWPGLPHVIHGYASMVDDVVAALDVVGSFTIGHWAIAIDRKE